MKTNELSKGFTLVELLIYVGIFAIVSVFLTGTLITSLQIQDRNVSGNEVNSQLNLVVNTAQRIVRESSLIEVVFEGADLEPNYDSSGNLTNPCESSYCGVRLRMNDSALDPTIIRADPSTNLVYVRQGEDEEVALTNNRVTVDSLVFIKNEIPGAHATLQIDATISFVGATPSTSTARSVVARVNAAVFDSDLIPNVNNTFNVGSGVNSWRDGLFSGDLSADGSITIGSDPQTVYRCDDTTGNLTTEPTSCSGDAVDTGLRVK